MAFSSAISIEKYAINRFTELTVLTISLASLLGAGHCCRTEKHASLNLRLSGIRPAQASGVEMACVHSWRFCIALVPIGIGGAVTCSPLPHHRTGGSAYGGSAS